MRRGGLAAVAAGMAALLALAGCAAGGGDSGGGSAEQGPVPALDRGAAGGEPGAEPGADAGAGAPADPADGGDGDGSGTAGGAIIDTRSIVYTGEITVRVSDVGQAAREATELAQRHGGFVGGDRRSVSGDDDQARATLVLRIPADAFTAAVEQLSELGEEESREISTEDVTEEVVDLRTRIATAEASVARTRDLLERATSIDDIVRVEAELSEREGALASLQARQRRLADLTTLSTITARLLAREATPAAEDEAETGFLAGLAAGWRAFTQSVTVLLTGLGVLLPWLVTIGVPAGAGVWWTRRRRALRPPAADPGGTPVP